LYGRPRARARTGRVRPSAWLAVLADAMIGDRGAHALGAALGRAVVMGNGRAGLLAHAAVLVAVAAYGDKVSEAAGSLGER
jgi:hypothetical protein